MGKTRKYQLKIASPQEIQDVISRKNKNNNSNNTISASINNIKESANNFISNAKHSTLLMGEDQQDIVQARWQECLKCEYLIKATGNCKKCGCFMQLKTKMAGQKCPIGKWGAVPK